MFIRDTFGNLVFAPRGMCFAEAEGAAEGGGSADGAAERAPAAAAEAAGKQEGAEGAAAGTGKEGAAAAAEGAAKGKEGEQAAADWRASLTDEEAKKFAERSPDLNHLIKRAKEANDRLSKAIIPPGKDAKPEDIEAYRKQIGVPQAPDGYKFEMPEDSEPTEGDKAFHGKMAEAFHALNITKEQAKGLNQVWNDVTAAVKAEQVAEDKRYAEQSEAQLRQEWRGEEFGKNKAHAERAAAQMFGDDFDEIRRLESKDGRFIMDDPRMLRALAAVGREMAEGGLVPPMSADQAEQAQDELKSLREKTQAAQERGDSKEANRLYQKEQALIAKMHGAKPVVGSQGRAA